MKLINCLLLLIVISTVVGLVQAQKLQYETVTKMAEDSDCAACHPEPHTIHENTSATCQQCHGEKLTDNKPECNKCHSGTIHNAPTKTAETPYEVLGAISTTGITFKATSIDNPSVLYYDLEDRDGYSSITFPLYDNLIIPIGELNYTTISWGDYIGWGSKKYFVIEHNVTNWIIAEKLVDEDSGDYYYIFDNQTLSLSGGWGINAKEIDPDNKTVLLSITKDDVVIYSETVNENNNFVYEANLGASDKTDILNLTVETVSIFEDGLNSKFIKINNIDLVSTDTLEIENNDTNLYDDYVIKTSTSQISILNEIDISLSKEHIEDIISGLFSVRINEDGDMAGLVREINEPGIHEIVGATNASTGTMLKATSADNPAVLYYNLEDKVGYESIRLTLYSNLSVPVGEMNYTTIPWGQNIAWGGSKYAVVSSSSSEWIIAKKLIDEDQDDDHILRVGDTLVLPGGWSITAVEIDVDGEEVWFTIKKDGEEMDDEVVTTDPAKGDPYFVYEDDLDDDGDDDDVVMNFTVETVFAGMNTNIVKINNIDLISTDVLKINNNDASLYDGYIVKTNPDQLTVLNDFDIELSKGNLTNVIGNLFAVRVNGAGNLGALVKEVKVDEYVSPKKYIIKDRVIFEGDGYQINNYFVEVSDITFFSGDLMLKITIYQLNSDGSYDELTTSTTLVFDKRCVRYQYGLIYLIVQEKNLTSQYTIVDIYTFGFNAEYEKYVTGGVANAQYYIPEQSPYSYTMTLLKGWNLVSTPIVPDDSNVKSIFDSNEEVIVPVYTWSTTNKQYYEVNEIELGKGYWVLALNNTNVTFSGTPYSG